MDRFLDFMRFATLVKDATLNPRWTADGDGFWWVEGAPDRTVARRFDVSLGESRALLDTARIREHLKRELGHEPPYGGLPFADLALTERDDVATFQVEGRAFRYRISTDELSSIAAAAQPAVPKPEANEVRSPDGTWFAGVHERNLRIRSAVDGRFRPLTTDGPELVWTAPLWSPDSLKIAAIRDDQTLVVKHPVVHWLKPLEEVEWVPMTKVGEPLPRTEPHVIDTLSGAATKLDVGELADHRVRILAWLPGSREVLVVKWDRPMRTFTVYACDASCGASRVVLTETSTFENWARVFGNYTGDEGQFWLLPSGERFLWLSERDGWMHLYLYSVAGGLERQLTTGELHVLKVNEIDEAGGYVWFQGHENGERPYDRPLFRVALGGGAVEKLTETDGWHDVAIAPSKTFFVDTHSTVSRKPRIEVRTLSGGSIATVREADTSALDEIGWTAPEEFSVPCVDGFPDVHGVLYKPPGFDPSKTYAVVESIYSGMQRTNQPHFFTDGHGALPSALAGAGFVSFVVDTPGTPGRGRAFHEYMHGRYGQLQIPDHVAVLRNLAATRPWMDLGRVGIVGGSWGGYTTLRAMLTAPEVYRVGVAMAPVCDFEDHLAIPIENFMGLIHENPDGYAKASCVPLAGNLKGKLLLVHGTSDVNATFSATMRMVEAFIRAGKPYDLIVLPEQPHSLTGVHAAFTYAAVRDYFLEHLR